MSTDATSSRPRIRPAATQLRHAIGGLAATMADAMLIFAPTANSYRRYRAEAYVPLNPNWARKQPRRGAARSREHAGEPPRRTSRRRRGCESLSARCSCARRDSSRTDRGRSIRARRSAATPMTTRPRRCRSHGPTPPAPSIAARFCATTSANSFIGFS